MTEEQRKWYLAGVADMEAGRLVRHGPLLVAESKPPALTAEEAKRCVVPHDQECDRFTGLGMETGRPCDCGADPLTDKLARIAEGA